MNKRYDFEATATKYTCICYAKQMDLFLIQTFHIHFDKFFLHKSYLSKSDVLFPKIHHTNDNKPAEHKNKICMIDASNIYTPKRAQNIMTDENIQEVCNLYADYKDIIEKCKIVTLDDIKEKDYTLSVNSYIEKKPQETIDPAVVKKEFLEALNAVTKAEDKLKQLLAEGGYIHE